MPNGQGLSGIPADKVADQVQQLIDEDATRIVCEKEDGGPTWRVEAS